MYIQKKTRAINTDYKKVIILLLAPFILIIFINIPAIMGTLHFTFPIFNIKDIIGSKTMQGFTTIFISIILEAFPFILLGTFISSLIQIFVSEETIARIIPKSRFLGILCAALIGLIFPVCDCAIVPIVRRLIKKGVPLYIAITFMLAVPIVNPIVLASTYYAFSNSYVVPLIRGSLGIISAMVIGNLIGLMEGKHNVLKNNVGINSDIHSHNHEHEHNHEHDHEHEHEDEEKCSCGHSHNVSKKGANPLSLIFEVFEHTSIELHDVGRFVILGAFLSALMQTFISREYITYIGKDKIYSVLVMMALAFLLAICSETDAFIARTFVGQFTTGSILAFLIFGPMIDIKNTFMLGSTFKAKFVIKLIFVIFAVCLIIGVVTNIIQYKGGLQWLNLINPK